MIVLINRYLNKMKKKKIIILPTLCYINMTGITFLLYFTKISAKFWFIILDFFIIITFFKQFYYYYNFL